MFWKIWLGLVRRESGGNRLNSSGYFPNSTFLWIQTLFSCTKWALYHFEVNNWFFYKSWKIIHLIKIQYCFNTVIVFWTTDLNGGNSCFIATDLLDQLLWTVDFDKNECSAKLCEGFRLMWRCGVFGNLFPLCLSQPWHQPQERYSSVCWHTSLIL